MEGYHSRYPSLLYNLFSRFILKFVSLLGFLFLLFGTLCFSQDITFIPQTLHITDTLGKEIVFNCTIKNISTIPQTVFLVRTKNILPPSWSSSLCFDPNCFPGTLDSIATTPEFGGRPFSSQEERNVSIHVYTYQPVQGIATVEVQAGSFSNPNSRIILDLTAEAHPVAVNDKAQVVNNYNLVQNYPNPFNPNTKIKFELASDSKVVLKIFNVLGEEVAALISKNLPAGKHESDFNASNLNSGIYFYRLEATGNNGSRFTSIKKMILIK